MYKTINSTHTGWNRMLCLLLVLLANLAQAQQGSWGNIRVHGDGRMTVFGAHSFSPGLVTTQRNGSLGVVVFGPAATYTGANDASHVDGYVTKSGTAAFDFPVGSDTKLRTIGISAPAATGQFRAAYWGTNPSTAAAGTTGPAAAPFPAANLGTGVTGVSTAEFWELTGAQAVDVKLTWTAAVNPSSLVSGNIANLIVVGYSKTTSKWEKLGTATTTTGTLTAAGSITATAVTPDDYSAITFGTSAAVGPDLRSLITMNDRSFVKPTAMSKPLTVRIANLATGTTTTGNYDVYLSVGSAFTAVMNTAPGWTFTDLGGGDYQLRSSAAIAGGTVANVPLTLTAKTTASKGTYNISLTIDDNAGGDTNNTNNNATADVSISL